MSYSCESSLFQNETSDPGGPRRCWQWLGQAAPSSGLRGAAKRSPDTDLPLAAPSARRSSSTCTPGMIVQLFLSRRTLFDHLPVIVSFSLSLGRPTLIFLVSISYFTLHTLLPLCLSHLLWHPQPSKTLVDLVVANPSGPGIAPAS